MQTYPASHYLHKPIAAKPKRTCRKLGNAIRDRLALGMKPRAIARELECEPSAVYYHMRKRAKRSALERKLARFNRLYHKNLGMALDRKTLEQMTECKCAFTGRPIDLEQDRYCLALLDGLPLLYLAEYHGLRKLGLVEHEARCVAYLQSQGYTVKPPTCVSHCAAL